MGAARLLAALGIGAVLFQAAQSLQVPAFEPRLLGLWSAAALLHGYATRAYLPFLVGVVSGVSWWFTQPMWDEPSGLTVVMLFGAGSVLAAGTGRAPRRSSRHLRLDVADRRRRHGPAGPLRRRHPRHRGRPDRLVLLARGRPGGAGLVAAGAVATRPGVRALEPLGAIVVLVVATLIGLWSTGADSSDVDASDWLHAATSVAAYVLLAVALVALGTVREHPPLTWMAMVGLVVFTTFQSFAVFAPIVTGAWLFVVLGTVFLGTGFLFDRARRELAQALDTDSTSTEGADR